MTPTLVHLTARPDEQSKDCIAVVRRAAKFARVCESQSFRAALIAAEKAMSNVVDLNNITKLDLPAERVLRRALEADLEHCVITGTTKDGKEYFCSTQGDAGSVLYWLKRAEHRLMRTVDQLSGEE